MKYFLLLIFLPLFSFGQVTDQALTGLWVKVKAQMKDGSRMIDHHGCGMDFLKYNFTGDGFTDMSNEVFFDGFRIQTKVKGDSLIIGGTVYNILGLAKDTLQLSFFAPFGVQDKQLPVYYFVKTPVQNVNTTATFNPALKDSVYQATKEFFPVCKGTLGALMSWIDGRYDQGTLKASFIVDKKGKVKSFTVLKADTISNGFAKSVGNAFGNLSWAPARKNNIAVNTIVQVTVKTGHKVYAGTNQIMNTLSVEYPFLPQPPYSPLSQEEVDATRQALKEAITQSNNGHYERALELLNQCIQIDSIELDAYYLKAFIHSSLSKKKEACEDWSILAGLGQVEAIQNLAKFCKN